jgi:hypothetical protein
MALSGRARVVATVPLRAVDSCASTLDDPFHASADRIDADIERVTCQLNAVLHLDDAIDPSIRAATFFAWPSSTVGSDE